MRAEGGGGIGAAKAMSLGRKVFAKVDDNRDGLITGAELKRSGVAHKMGLLSAGESEKQWMARVDANKDGVLSRAEAEAAFAAAAYAKAGAAIAAALMTQGMAEFPYAQEAPKEAEEKPSPAPASAAEAPPAPSASPAQNREAQSAYAAIDRLAQEQAQNTLSSAA